MKNNENEYTANELMNMYEPSTTKVNPKTGSYQNQSKKDSDISYEEAVNMFSSESYF